MDSSFNDDYFYNPLNSLSVDDQDASLSMNKSTLINQNPMIMGKRTDTLPIDDSLQD